VSVTGLVPAASTSLRSPPTSPPRGWYFPQPEAPKVFPTGFGWTRIRQFGGSPPESPMRFWGDLSGPEKNVQEIPSGLDRFTAEAPPPSPAIGEKKRITPERRVFPPPPALSAEADENPAEISPTPKSDTCPPLPRFGGFSTAILKRAPNPPPKVWPQAAQAGVGTVPGPTRTLTPDRVGPACCSASLSGPPGAWGKASCKFFSMSGVSAPPDRRTWRITLQETRNPVCICLETLLRQQRAEQPRSGLFLALPLIPP